MVLASCEKEVKDNAVTTPFNAPLSFVVSSPETKTTLDGLHVHWAAGDEIRVYGHNTETDTYTDNAVYELTDGAGEGTATFTIKDGESMSGTYDAYYALYPGSLTATVDATNMVLPRLNSSPHHMRAQSPSEGQCDPNLAIMTAKYDGGRLVFRHGVAYIKITIPDDDVTKIDINFTTNCIADTPTYNTSTGSISSVGNSAKNVTSVEGTFTKGTTYYFAAVPRAGYAPSTTTITFSGGNTYSTTHFTAALEVGKVYNLGMPQKNPAFTASDVNIESDDTAGSINFTVANLKAGGEVTKEVLAGATISNLSVGAVSFNTSTGVGSIDFTCDANDDTENPKTATVRLTYTYDTDKTATKDVTITQKKKGGSVDYVWDFASSEWQTALEAQAAAAKSTDNSSWTVSYDDLTFTAGGSNAKWDSTYITTGGTGSKTKRVFTFTATAAGTLSVWSSNTSNKEDTSRKVNVAVGTNDPEVKDGGAASSAPAQLDFDITAGDVYIYTTSSLRIYKIEFHE